MASGMADIGARTWRAVVDECAARPELFAEDDLALLHIIGLRLEHGLELSRNQRGLLEHCADRLIDQAGLAGREAGGK